MMANRLLSSATRQFTHRLSKSQQHFQQRFRKASTAFATSHHNFTTDTSYSSNPETDSNIFPKITFIGTGKMAQAMFSPLISNNLQTPSSITAFDVSSAALKRVQDMYPGVNVAKSIPEAINDASLIVYAVKPQNCAKVNAEILKAKNDQSGLITVRDDATILSVVAGKPISAFVEGSGVERVARSMPNTPAQIGAGVTVWSCTSNINSDERAQIKSVLDSFGKTVFVDDESFIDMSTSISGSGPAYIFLLMEAMIDAGVHMGFSRETATTLVHHTLLGSTKFAMETGEHPAVLRNSVTSPAGTTASAIYELENGKFRTVIKDAIWACYRRSLEMGGQSSQVGPGRHVTQEEDMPTVVSVPELKEVLRENTHHPVEPPMGEMSNVDFNGNGNGNGERKAA